VSHYDIIPVKQATKPGTEAETEVATKEKKARGNTGKSEPKNAANKKKRRYFLP